MEQKNGKSPRVPDGYCGAPAHDYDKKKRKKFRKKTSFVRLVFSSFFCCPVRSRQLLPGGGRYVFSVAPSRQKDCAPVVAERSDFVFRPTRRSPAKRVTPSTCTMYSVVSREMVRPPTAGHRASVHHTSPYP